MASWAPLCQSDSVSWCHLNRLASERSEIDMTKTQRHDGKNFSAVLCSHCNSCSRFWFLPKTSTGRLHNAEEFIHQQLSLWGEEGRQMLTTPRSWFPSCLANFSFSVPSFCPFPLLLEVPEYLLRSPVSSQNYVLKVTDHLIFSG